MNDIDNINIITEEIISAAIKIHKAIGPGLLESTYEACMLYELNKNKYKVDRQKKMPVIYQKVKIDFGYRIDLLVEGKVIVELKSVEKILPIHKAQLLSYLKLSSCKVGLLINFNVRYLRDGIHRMIL